MNGNRKVRCVYTGILFPEGKGRLLEKHFESRGHPSAAKYLCIGKSGPQTAKAFKDKKKNPHYLHRQWGVSKLEQLSVTDHSSCIIA